MANWALLGAGQIRVDASYLLCRRVNKFRGTNTGLLALARRREELKHSQIADRENKVTLFRKYRTGELPDIQRVTIAAFLGPLGTALNPVLLPVVSKLLIAVPKHS